ncbi:recombinase family protein [Micromonospora sp. NPDC049101]|uniref:recombinase family protein n=1 Tax=Micromonospora sp. NPDC049101 TaxID=3155032 RepID=UPI0033C1BD53
MSVSNGTFAQGMRLVGAVRLSRHRGEADPTTSPERQEGNIEAEARNRGGTIVGWAKDLDVSAIKLSPFSRPKLGAWLRPDRVNDFDGLVWSRLDRAVRSMADLHTLAQWATTHRKVLIFVNGPGGGSMALDMRAGPLDPIPHLIVTILAFAAQMEAQAITERIRESKAYLRQAGRWSGGMYPYHLIPVREGNGWVLADNPDTIPVMEDIISRAMRKQSKQSIAAYLNKQEILSPRDYRHTMLGRLCVAPVAGKVEEIGEYDEIAGKGLKIAPDEGGDPQLVRLFPVHGEWAVKVGDHVESGQRLTLPLLWNAQNIKHMLTSRVLLGETTYEGKPVLGPDGMPIKRANPRMNREDFAKLQIILEQAGASHMGQRSSGASLLLDTGHCPLCGEGLNFRAQSERYKYYNCRSSWGVNKRQSKEERCKAKAMDAPTLERIVEKLLMANVGDLKVLTPVTMPKEDHRDELQAASEALTDLINRSAGKGEAVRAIYGAQIAALEEKVTALSALPVHAEKVVFRETGKTYRQLWEESDRDERRRLLLESGVRVEARRILDGKLRPGDRRGTAEYSPGYRFGLFERPERYDQAVALTIEDGVQVAVYLPNDLHERAGGVAGVPLGYALPETLF